MSERLVATLNVAFDDDGDGDGTGSGAGKNRIILEQATRRFDFNGNLWVRGYSGVTYRLATSAGTAAMADVASRDILREGLKFSNSASATLKYPTASGVTITPGVLMKKIKNNYGQTRIVEASDVTLRYDSESTSVIAESGVPGKKLPTPVYGVAFVSYSASYDHIRYTPGIERIHFTQGVSFTIGTVYGYHDYDVASVDMEVDIQDAETKAAYARVYSKIVLDSKGVWEFPPNWQSTYDNNQRKSGDDREDYPSEGTFPNHPTRKIDADNSFVDERVHVIIHVNTMGQLSYEYPKGIQRIYAPYWGHANYTPQYHGRFAEPPGGSTASSAEEFLFRLNNRGWHTVFLDVDKDEIKSRLEKNYRGITFDS